MSLSTFLAAARRAMTRPADADRLDQIDEDLMDAGCPIVDEACRAWFDLTVEGQEHLPEGPALLVGNHNAGITFVEALGFGARMYLEGHMDKPWHALAHDAVVGSPLMGPFLISAGALRATHANADAAFRDGRKVLVFPGGNLEAFRPWSERHRITFGGHKGFVKLAIRHGVPIVPVVFHGGHDGFVVLSDNRRLARLIGARRFLRSDTWPLWVGLPWGVALGPWFHLPLPVTCRTRILPPIATAQHTPDAARDPEVVDALYAQVTATMQQTLDELAATAEPPVRAVTRRLRELAGRSR